MLSIFTSSFLCLIEIIRPIVGIPSPQIIKEGMDKADIALK